MSVIAIIPARSGSKGIENKNIRLFNGLPLLVHSIKHAQQSRHVDRVLLSTDSEVYRQIALEHGAEVPFLRPADISGDFATDLDVFQHALQWLQTSESRVPEICVHLRPTYPLRQVADIDAMIELLQADHDADAVRSISVVDKTPFKMWFKNDRNQLSPVVTSPDIDEAYNQPRQRLPQAYTQNACIDVVRSATILQGHSMTGKKILGYEMDHYFDIDTEEQWRTAELFAAADLSQGGKASVFCFDIDGVIASIVDSLDYAQALPLRANIELINRLYDMGHEVQLFTARGSKTGKDWEAVTRQQLTTWGVRFTSLRLGKPVADFYIDDRFISIDLLRSILQRKA